MFVQATLESAEASLCPEKYFYHGALFTAFYYCGVSDWRTYIGIPASLALATVSSLGMERPLLRPWRRLDAAASLIARLLDNHRFLDHP